MSATILSRTINSIVDQRIVLLNQSIGRALSFGSTWNDIRIGVRLSINTGGNAFSGGGLFVGICSGTSALYGEASTTHAVGMRFLGPSPWTFYAPYGLIYTNVQSYYVTKVGTSETVGSTSSYSYEAFAGVPGTAVSMMGIQIIRQDATTLLLQESGLYQASSVTHVTKEAFLGVMESSGFIAACNSVNVGQIGSQRAMTINEATNGPLNALCFHWSHGTVGLEISDIAVAKFA